MFLALKQHPFAVEAYFKSSMVLTFAVPLKELASLIPPCVQLDSFEDTWGFIAVAMVDAKGLRPKGFPSVMGNDFFLVGYRIFVRYINTKGKRLRGLYILKSQTNKRKMEYLGNIFTHYKYSTIDIEQIQGKHDREIYSRESGFSVKVSLKSDQVSLPSESPFQNWKEARRFAGPLPFTFTYLPRNREVLIIEGVRQNWKPEPVEVLNYDFPFLEELGITKPRLANTFLIQSIPYHWKKGKLESWKP